MPTALDAPPDVLDPAERRFVAMVREHGWHRTSVFGDGEGPGFSFTTGFWVSAQTPELIAFSIRNEDIHDIFWAIFRDLQSGKRLRAGAPVSDVLRDLPVYLFPVAKTRYADYLGWSRWFYGSDDFPCLQLVWPDRAGIFPWQAGFDPDFAGDQVDLTEDGWLAAISN